MRKKLFAVIMSAMMMITFMPAMAFASLDGPTTTTPGWYVSPFTGAVGTTNDFTYDGAEHEVTYVAAKTGKLTSTITYSGAGTVLGKAWTYAASATAPKVKDAGTYYITAEEKYTYKTNTYLVTSSVYNPLHVGDKFFDKGETIKDPADVKEIEDHWNVFQYHVTKNGERLNTATIDFGTLTLTVNPRPVEVKAAKNVTLTKDYDGKGFTIEDSFFQISSVTPGTDATEADKKWLADHTGLVAGDKLILKSFTTPADADTYVIDWNAVTTNPNYRINNEDTIYVGHGAYKHLVKVGGLEKWVNQVTIKQADNNASIASQVLTIKRGSSKAVKFSTTWGTKKLTKLSGNTKISVKNGKVKVAKSCKKGTYKIKVKASAAGTKNWVKASRTKTLTIKVM